MHLLLLSRWDGFSSDAIDTFDLLLGFRPSTMLLVAWPRLSERKPFSSESKLGAREGLQAPRREVAARPAVSPLSREIRRLSVEGLFRIAYLLQGLFHLA